MNKIIITISVPSIKKEFDIIVDLRIQISILKKLLQDSIADITNGEYESSENSLLCLSRRSIVLDEEKSAYECGIENGDTILLF